MTSALRDRPKDSKLRILHVLRAPLGGLYRHVVDLTYEQIARGHAVGLVTDSTTGGENAIATLGKLEPLLQLGLLRLPMRRQPHLSDLATTLKIAAHIRALDPDVIHGHGSKGGVYARASGFAPGLGEAIRAYTPHGGSFNYRAHPIVEATLMRAEKLLVATTDIFLFESAFIANCFRRRVGEPDKLIRIVPNGIKPAEFEPVPTQPDAADFVYVGELRAVKGIDTLIDALALVVERRRTTTGTPPRLLLVGTGPEERKLSDHAVARNVRHLVSFPGAMPAREAFARGRILVVPSRAESLPYVVLEAAAAQMPMIATNVGGIGEIYGPYRDRLIPCDNAEVLAATLETTLARPSAELRHEAALLSTYVASKYTIDAMTDAVLNGYAEAIAARNSRRGTDATALAMPSR
ncbi:MAG TPA: glycosyltransferase family 4 protein [Methylovirgula sp.]